MDLNVAAAWAQGVTGKNVTTAIMDDGKTFFLKAIFPQYYNFIMYVLFFLILLLFFTGVDYMHPDILHNYVRILNYTFHTLNDLFYEKLI